MRLPVAVIITTAPQTIRTFFPQQIRDLRAAGFEVQAISAPGPDRDACRAETGIEFHSIPMKRSISPVADCVAVWRLTGTLRKIRPRIVQTHTPKAGLLGMMAATLAGVPFRIYTVNGLVWESASGWRSAMLRAADRVAATLATQVLCVSHSVRELLIARGICRRGQAVVLGHGGSHGVDIQRFDPSGFPVGSRRAVREAHGIPEAATTLGFVGRFVPDKGIDTLLRAWSLVRDRLPEAVLVLVGDREPSHPLTESLWNQAQADPRIHITRAGPREMAGIYAVLDVLVLPTLREGLPNVLLEAAAMEIPVVASRATGCVDVVRDGETGILFRTGDAGELAEAIVRLSADRDLRVTLGQAARRHVAARFSEETVSAALVAEYRRLLSAGGANAAPAG